MRLLVAALLLLPAALGTARAQEVAPDSARTEGFVQEAIYARPYIGRLGSTAVGGYAEANTNYFVEDGITEGFSLEMRRFNLFVFSAISERITLTSELEFEHGAEEIALETALIDFTIAPELVLRGGILLPPIGAFNQNHDSPLWEFVDRPLVSTEIIPSTLSEVGVGAHGQLFPSPQLGVSYDVYLTNGLSDGIVLNEQGRTSIPAGRSEKAFAEDNNGTPALSARIAAKYHALGEVGLSYYGGAYNRFRIEGDEVDEARRVDLLALDLKASLLGVDVRGEAAAAWIDVPESLNDEFGGRQWGAHLDVIAPVWQFQLLGYEAARLNATLRLEAVDYNQSTFSARTVGEGNPAVGDKIYDELVAVVPGFSFRPNDDTVFKLNYRRQWHRDLLGNPAAVSAGIQVGFATYF
ncbi:MAG: hypothetical protein HKN04_05470 [Rhodothermaceae bacterium]|nr:hypothetical protein [Rhodothermaceae bacterium]